MNIHCNVSGQPDAAPILVPDAGSHVVGDLSVPNRCTFDAPDTINGGFGIMWNRQSARSVFPPYPRVPNYEGGELEPALPTLAYAASRLLRLRANGTRFETEDGAPFFGLTSTDFLMFQREALHGEDLTAVVNQRKAAGLNEHRVTLLMQFLPNVRGLPVLRPENYPGYFDHLRRWVGLMADRGRRVKLTGRCDMQHINRDPAWMRAFDLQVADALRDLTNWRYEAGNEWEVNGWDPREVHPVPGVFMSRGSSSIDRPPITPGFGWHENHRRRDWPKYANGEDLGFQSHGNIEGGADTMRPVDDGEPIGFDETHQEARRLNTPQAARAVRYSAEGFAAATCFHSTAGLFADLWGPVTEACGQAFGGVRV